MSKNNPPSKQASLVIKENKNLKLKCLVLIKCIVYKYPGQFVLNEESLLNKIFFF